MTLCILGETANDLRTLAATRSEQLYPPDAASATAGAIGLLGGVLGTFAAYAIEKVGTRPVG